MAKRSAPEVNAGSMADIAFLLLIFFLVTTTIETDSGLNRKLPPMDEVIDPPIIKQKNIFTVVVNKNNQLLVEEELKDISEVRSLAMEFLDNGGGQGEDACDYCKGKRDPSSSDNPEKAIISLKNDRETSYKVYIAVQNELVAAYNELRNREYVRLNPMSAMNFVEANSRYSDPRTSPSEKEKLKSQLSIVKQMYPQKLSEAEPNKS
ncbi:MAG: biopolymer transporter ExbD [Flavobacteriaceae bacterium]|nr:biopolymer transporter ExbD [Flavobacteriaceae bacterium]|tara:strand:+ start:5848 stop:6468 length:621 start_codon:yes stop_codon:yes gene_type:complete